MSRTIKLAIIPGDGTGPEVTAEACKVLEAVAPLEGVTFERVDFDYGGDRYLATGEVITEQQIDELRQFDAIYLGAIGHPEVKPGILEKGLLLSIRFQLDQYINLRPVKLYPGVDCPLKDKGPEHIRFDVIRENTEDLYCGAGGFLRKHTAQEIATQEMIATRFGADRCLRWAFEHCRRRNDRKQLTLVHKTNVLTFAANLWERAFHEMGAAEYPDITRDYNHIDAACMWFIKNPEFYDTIVVPNMFGDIITDHRRHDSGRPRRLRRRQHQPRSGRLQHVRVHGRLGPQVHRSERDQSDRRHRRHGHAARRDRRAEGTRQPGARRTARRCRHRRHHPEDEQHVRGPDGLLHQPDRGPGSRVVVAG